MIERFSQYSRRRLRGSQKSRPSPSRHQTEAGTAEIAQTVISAILWGWLPQVRFEDRDPTVIQLQLDAAALLAGRYSCW